MSLSDPDLLLQRAQRVSDGVEHRQRHGQVLDLGEDPAIKERREPVAWVDRHMVITGSANVQIARQFAVKQHRPAFRAFGPQVLGHLTARKQRVDLRSDVVRNPVHRLPCGHVVAPSDIPQGGKLQRRGPGMGKHLQARPFILAKILPPEASVAKDRSLRREYLDQDETQIRPAFEAPFWLSVMSKAGFHLGRPSALQPVPRDEIER